MKKTNSTEKPTAYAFIDSQNLNLGIQRAGWKLDWKKFLKFLQDEYNVKKAYLFIGYIAEYETMYNQLHELGYYIVLKPTVESNPLPTEAGQAKPQEPGEKKPDEEERKPVVKGNIDAELVLYAMKEMPNYQKAIIASGDGDFYCLAEYLADKKRLLHILAPNWKYSSLLKPYDEYVVRLDQMRRMLEYKTYRRASNKQNAKSS